MTTWLSCFSHLSWFSVQHPSLDKKEWFSWDGLCKNQPKKKYKLLEVSYFSQKIRGEPGQREGQEAREFRLKEAWSCLKISLVKKVLRTIEFTAVEFLKNVKLFVYLFFFREAQIRRRNILLSNIYQSLHSPARRRLDRRGIWLL